MAAILVDAVDCFQKYFRTRSQHERGIFADAEEWLFAESSQDGLGLSFEYVCSAIGLDPDYVRRGLRHWCRSHSSAGRIPQAAA
jgi:hypothetical protein